MTIKITKEDLLKKWVYHLKKAEKYQNLILEYEYNGNIDKYIELFNKEINETNKS